MRVLLKRLDDPFGHRLLIPWMAVFSQGDFLQSDSRVNKKEMFPMELDDRSHPILSGYTFLWA